ncbi:hypothetical protein [Usitatibacter rugosus]|uniref:hypothetical protein n=1 Tax=Usitatibacter rugosus TaxID=2732067 RepID=UPI001489B0D4|nr:hypothetical protein [Usitatibacter rugosus]
MLNLNVIEVGTYHAHGSHGLSASSTHLPLEAHFEAESFPNALVLEGKWQTHSDRPAYAFRVELSRDHTSQSQADATVTATGVGVLSGRMSMRGPTLELLASDSSSGSQLSARFVPMEKSRTYEISGIVSFKGQYWFPFHFRAVPLETALAKVVALPKRSA